MPLDGLYETLTAAWVPYVKVLREHKDVALDRNVYNPIIFLVS
jgi:hypothetical protein